jgi:pyruvate-ferredoxin/flavodoxin oxidoreductase
MLKESGQNPFTLDSKDPTGSYQEFIGKEIRYTSLKLTKPEAAEVLFKKAEQDAKERMDSYKKLAEG